MRITYFLPRCTPENSHGRYVIELLSRLRSGNQVTVYSSRFWEPVKSWVRCRRLPLLHRPALARIGTLWAESIISVDRFSSDIVHIQGADAPVGNVVTAHFCN